MLVLLLRMQTGADVFHVHTDAMSVPMSVVLCLCVLGTNLQVDLEVFLPPHHALLPRLGGLHRHVLLWTHAFSSPR